MPLVLVRHCQRRSQHTKPFDAAVIGGGITGLTTAFRLSQEKSCSQVTLYEKAPRIGGWIQSETISVDGGHVVFEYGPRTLRVEMPSSLPLLDLVRGLPPDPVFFGGWWGGRSRFIFMTS
jgi:oxygen-dependent protoporphyrinogen oxidase